MKFNTDVLHAEQLHAKLTGSYSPTAMAHVSPIYQTSTYILEDFDSAVYLNQHVDEGFVYTRFGSPNCDELEKKIAHLEHAEAALMQAQEMRLAAQIRKMKELRDKYGATIILVTHNMGVASYLSDKIGVMCRSRMSYGTFLMYNTVDVPRGEKRPDARTSAGAAAAGSAGVPAAKGLRGIKRAGKSLRFARREIIAVSGKITVSGKCDVR